MPTLTTRTERRKSKDYLWVFREERTELAREIARQHRFRPVVARLLANRGLADDADKLHEFIEPGLGLLRDPFSLRDMETAVQRVLAAHQSNQTITIYGDYDTDGTTSTAVLFKTLTWLGIKSSYYIPHRLEEGYGLNGSAIERLARDGTNLIITVDNGITANREVALARELGMDVVVTDHHQPGAELPSACAIVNPNRADCSYPEKGLTGVGVAFKFSHALMKRMGRAPDECIAFLKSLLDLVAIGTISDVAPLTGENRVMVRYGLEQMARTAHMGLQSLKRSSAIHDSKLNTRKVGFQIAPRLNAAGRTDSARICVELLTTGDAHRADEIAQTLEQCNSHRRGIENEIFENAREAIERNINLESDRVIVVAGEGWHVGVIGIVASKIMDLFDRPAIVVSLADGFGKGSARSIKTFNIHQALQATAQWLVTFGGHPCAAGLQLKRECVDDFRRAINDYAREVLDPDQMQPMLTIDTIIDATELDLETVKQIGLMEPFGQSNPHPLLVLRGALVCETPRTVGTDHLKLMLRAGQRRLSAIGFGMSHRAAALASNPGAPLDIAFVPSISTFSGEPRVELELKDIKIRAAS